MGGSFLGGNFLGGNFPGGNFPGGSLMGGNFPGGDFPDTWYRIFLIPKQKYCFERKNWIAMKAKKIVLSLVYHFCKKNTGIENI